MAVREIKKKWVGLSGPLVRGDNGYFTSTSGMEAIKASVLMAFGTFVGSRVHRRSYGSRLVELVMEQNDSVVSALAIEYIRETLSFDSRVSISNLKVERDSEHLNISGVLTEVATGNQTGFDFGFNI